MKVIVFGSNGMQGRYLVRYFTNKGYDVVPLERKDINVARTNVGELLTYGQKHNWTDDDVIVNAAGTIKPRCDELGEQDAIAVNALFPHMLAQLPQHVIHLTTDCVFSGEKGRYTEEDAPDTHDLYGRTKSLGESQDSTVIRTSILGEELGQTRSLIEWVKSQERGSTIQGYADHYWNGLTCLTLSEIIEQIISKNLYWKGVRHIFGADISKYELVRAINDAFDLGLNIEEVTTGSPVDRRLRSVHVLPVGIDYERQHYHQLPKLQSFIIG